MLTLNTASGSASLKVMAICAKCGKEIPAGQEIKKGNFLMKKTYHKDCV
jgi:hypothetical protein